MPQNSRIFKEAGVAAKTLRDIVDSEHGGSVARQDGNNTIDEEAARQKNFLTQFIGEVKDRLDVVRGKDREVVEKIKGQLDALLTFAGIYSAAVVAFITVSYAQLNPPALDPSSVILAQISAQLASLHIQGNYLNSTAPAFNLALGAPSQRPTSSTLAVNILWFTALILSLTAACVNIATRLLFTYCVFPDNSNMSNLYMIYYKLAKTLVKDSGPLWLLQIEFLEISVMSFLAGLVCLLWPLSKTVAYVVLGEVIVAFGIISIVFTIPSFMQTLITLISLFNFRPAILQFDW